jgi:ubiquinone/menaquinone biosynthesis C-methylase UbiE
MLELTLKEVDAREGEVILDVGCGKAIDAAKLSKSGALVVGIEPSKVMLARAKEHLSKTGEDVALTQGIGEKLALSVTLF